MPRDALDRREIEPDEQRVGSADRGSRESQDTICAAFSVDDLTRTWMT